MEQNLGEIVATWKQTADLDLIKAATKNWEEYAPHVRGIIEAESKRRGLWEKVLYLRGDRPEYPISSKGDLAAYICKNCKGTQLNTRTGRCSQCNFPIEGFSYCKTCEEFFCIPPGRSCPKDGTKLVRRKAATDFLRLGHFVIDFSICGIAYVILVILLTGTDPQSFERTDPLTDFILRYGMLFSYYLIFESLWQRTPAKFITGAKVVDAHGRKPAPHRVLLRTLTRFVPFEAFSFPGRNAFGWHDRWSQTYVIKAKRVGGKTLKTDTALGATDALEKEPFVNTDLLEQSRAPIRPSHYEESLITRTLSDECAAQEQGENPKTTYESDEAETSEQRTGETIELDRPGVVLGRLEKCANCDRIIGKLEHCYNYRGSFVCVQCRKRLIEEV